MDMFLVFALVAITLVASLVDLRYGDTSCETVGA